MTTKELEGITLDAFSAAALGEFYSLSEGLRFIDINGRNAEDWTMMMYAVYYGRTLCVQYLITNGADVTMLTKSGRSSLSLAVVAGDIDILSMDSLVNLKDNEDMTPIFYATIHGHSDIVEYLLSHGALPNTFSNGKTPLMSAAERGHFEVVRNLLRGGADPTVPGEDKKRAKDYALKNNHLDIYDYIEGFEMQDLKVLLKNNGLEKYLSLFEDNGITYQMFLNLSENALKDIGIKAFGPRRKLGLLIKDLKCFHDF